MLIKIDHQKFFYPINKQWSFLSPASFPRKHLFFSLIKYKLIGLYHTYLMKNTISLAAIPIQWNTPSLPGTVRKKFQNKFPPELNVVILNKESQCLLSWIKNCCFFVPLRSNSTLIRDKTTRLGWKMQSWYFKSQQNRTIHMVANSIKGPVQGLKKLT